MEMALELGLQGLHPGSYQRHLKVFELPLEGESFVLDPIEIQLTNKRFNRRRWPLSCGGVSGKCAQKVE